MDVFLERVCGRNMFILRVFVFTLLSNYFSSGLVSELDLHYFQFDVTLTLSLKKLFKSIRFYSRFMFSMLKLQFVTLIHFFVIFAQFINLLLWSHESMIRLVKIFKILIHLK